MGVLVSIGDFSRMTYLSVKALRHYHDIGLLKPAQVDAATGYRSYDTSQIAIAQVIRRFRELDMPLEQVKEVVDAPDLGARNRAIVAYLHRMEAQLDHTRETVASLRALLEDPTPSQPHREVRYRTVVATRALAISERVYMDELEDWWAAAFDELHQLLTTPGRPLPGQDAALYEGEFFEAGHGRVTAFAPITGTPASSGRAAVVEIPAAELAVMTHTGSFADLDTTYAALGTVVAERALGVAGPIREYYLPAEPGEQHMQRIEVGWPIFHTAGRKP
jgi:DNA-binding transcriptional MerR regulator